MLDTQLNTLLRLRTEVANGLSKLNLKTVRDLLFYFPTRYVDAREYVAIAHTEAGQMVTISGVIKKLVTKKSFKTRIPMSEATVEDQSGRIRVLWFNQPYLAKMLSTGSVVTLSGKISVRGKTRTLTNPEIHTEKNLPIDLHDTLFARDEKIPLTPIYPETKGLSSSWIHHALERIIAHLEPFADPLPEYIRTQYSLPTIKTALIWIHFPTSKEDAEVARKRFAFEEMFTLQLAHLKERKLLAEKPAYCITIDTLAIADFTKRLHFPLTSAQERAVQEICSDLTNPHPMSRLLEGDVGSGKTAVAAIATYATILNRPLKRIGDSFGRSSRSDDLAGHSLEKQTFGNLQVAYMAPTEILATQHFESFIELFKHTNISIALITGSGCRKYPSKVASNTKGWAAISRTQLSKWVANGEIPIVIGTHALIQKNVVFKHLALTIIDEQHRFGLLQRQKLAKKDTHVPHLLSMTATPIPRTLSLTIFGDLDLSLLDEMPIGRKKVITESVHEREREKMYAAVRAELTRGRQCYVICPRIDEPDPEKEKALIAKSVTAEAKRLATTIFPGFRVGVVHSKMTKDTKENAMKVFAQHETDILVATSVVEVGVNVPNATLIIIEGAERFGLSQLHQLRGRVIRSTHQSYCYLLTESENETTKKRLSLFLQAQNGFELAEYDLTLRGTGELAGAKQWGVSDIGMDALRNLKLVQAARTSAQELLEKDVHLLAYPLLQENIAKKSVVHFE